MGASGVYLSYTKVSATSTTAQYLSGSKVPAGRMLKLTSVQVIDETNTWTYADLVARVGGTDYVIERYYPSAATKQYHFSGITYLQENAIPRVMVYGASAADVISATFNGVLF